jgi:peroxiredoxin
MENTPMKVGQDAPEFALMNQNKDTIKLAEYRGKKKVMLLFYPMDFSSVCTKEHCAFGPQIDKLTADGETVVFGVNCDHPFAHAAFKKQYNIPYDLLSDSTRAMVKAYGMYAGLEPFNCSKRGTVLIDKNGKIAHWEEVPMGSERSVESLAKLARR